MYVLNDSYSVYANINVEIINTILDHDIFMSSNCSFFLSTSTTCVKNVQTSLVRS